MAAITPNNYLGLDIGTVRTGVALANSVARIASPLTTIAADATALHSIAAIIEAEAIGVLVVGLPRSLSGADTDQTTIVRSFVQQLKQFNLPIHLQDEALSSRKAEAELEARGKAYAKGDIDALAATYILDDFLAHGS